MKQKVALIMIFLCVAASGLSCSLLEVIMSSMDEDATQTAIAKQRTVDAVVAVLSATETKRVSEIEEEKRIATAVAQQTKNTTIPVILSISFPSVIANDKREIPGTVEFYDEGGDASTLRFLVVSGSFDANEFTTKLVAGTKINGKLGFNIWCEGLQTIDLQIWVIDDQNNTSQPRTITYSCVDPSELPPSN